MPRENTKMSTNKRLVDEEMKIFDEEMRISIPLRNFSYSSELAIDDKRKKVIIQRTKNQKAMLQEIR